MSRTIIYATGNASKIEMMKNLFPHDEVLSLKDIHFDGEIVENGTTFQENAMIKAQAVQDFLKAQGKEYSVIGDDSGFCIDALWGRPGLASARYAWDHNYDRNRAKVLQEMQGIEKRNACMYCCLVELFPNGDYLVAEGKSFGKVLEKEEGIVDNKYGYHCIFFSDDLQKGLWEVEIEEWVPVSDRKRAFEKLLQLEKEYLEKK